MFPRLLGCTKRPRGERNAGQPSCRRAAGMAARPILDFLCADAKLLVRASGLVLLGVGYGASDAAASGYALREQSATALGNAFAGATAGADDLSYMFFNPAGLTRQSGSQVIVAATAILPKLHVRDAHASTWTGVPIGGSDDERDVGENAYVPAFYGLLDLQREFGLQPNIKIGLGVNVPFALQTAYSDGWVGRYHAIDSEIETVNINPAIAWEVVDGVSVAAGLQVQYMNARLTNAVDFGSIGQASGVPFAVPTQQDGLARVRGDDVGYGFNVGVLYEPWDGTRIGAAYRSAIHQSLHGNADFRLDSAGVGRLLATQGLFQDGGANADVTTPEMVSFGIYHEFLDDWAVMGEVEWTRWSRFHDLTINFDNPAQPSSITENAWKDTWFVALGATWRPDDAWTLRAGTAFDQDPNSTDRRTPRIPTDDRYWLSFGVGYQPVPKVSLNFGYTHIFLNDTSINLSADQPGNQFRGNLSGQADGSADILSLQVRWIF